RRVHRSRRVLLRTGRAMPLVSWSPDSEHLVLAGEVAGRRGLWTMRRDGSRLRRVPLAADIIVDADVDDFQTPSWSAKDQLAFVGQTREEDAAAQITTRIYAVQLDGSGLIAVSAPQPDVMDTAPSWSRSGDLLAYVHDEVYAQGALTVAAPETGITNVVDRH